MQRSARILIPAGIFSTIAACILPDESITIMYNCGEEWASNADGAQGWNGQDYVDVTDANLEPVEVPDCLTQVQSADADESMSQVYMNLQSITLTECQSRASIMSLTMDTCSSNVSAPVWKRACKMDIDDCDPAIDDGGETGADGGDETGFGDVSPEVDCFGNVCVLSDDFINTILTEPESTWDEEGLTLDLVGTGPDGWELSGVAAGKLADVLGFQDDDLFVSVDGIQLDSFAAMLVAGTYANGQDSVRVEYRRSTNTKYKTFVRVCDGYGSATGTSYDWVDLSSTGTALSLTDDSEANVSLPFYFQFYGVVYDEIWVGANGAIRFNSGDVAHTNASIPSSASTSPDIAVFWDDLNPSSGGDAYYYQDEANARFIISWEGVPHYSNIGEIDVQIHLYESGRIEFHYQDGYFGNSSYDYGKSATVGIQDHVGANTATSYNQITYNTLWETGMASEARAWVPDCD